MHHSMCDAQYGDKCAVGRGGQYRARERSGGVARGGEEIGGGGGEREVEGEGEWERGREGGKGGGGVTGGCTPPQALVALHHAVAWRSVALHHATLHATLHLYMLK
jgi:hypothetical protein